MVNQAIQMVLLNPICLGLILIGVIIGIIFGSIPGLSASMAMILFLPMSFGMEPMNGISLLAGLFGISLSLVGIAPVDGAIRFTFGQSKLYGGFDTVVILIGLYAVTDIIRTGFERRDIINQSTKYTYSLKGYGIGFKEYLTHWRNIIQSALIGLGIGILPGIGGSTSSLLAYSAAKGSSEHPEKFGTGIVDGLIASETANNAVIGGSLIPLITMGIPGNVATAIFLGGLTIHGISPGPLIFQKSGQYVYGIFIALLVANIFMIIFERAGLRVFVKMLDIPKYILLPIVMVCCVVGAYCSNYSIFDVWCVAIFGLVGLGFKYLKIPATPMIIGFILGSMTEENLRQALMQTGGDWSIFVTRPISLIFLVIAVFSVAMTVRKQILKGKKA